MESFLSFCRTFQWPTPDLEAESSFRGHDSEEEDDGEARCYNIYSLPSGLHATYLPIYSATLRTLLYIHICPQNGSESLKRMRQCQGQTAEDALSPASLGLKHLYY